MRKVDRAVLLKWKARDVRIALVYLAIAFALGACVPQASCGGGTGGNHGSFGTGAPRG